MSPRTVATSTTLSTYTQRTVLDGREYALVFSWNQREAKWYLDLFTVDGVLIVAGIKLVVGAPLLRLLRSTDAPPGELFIMDRSQTGEDPGLNDLGMRCLLVYYPAADLVTAAPTAFTGFIEPGIPED